MVQLKMNSSSRSEDGVSQCLMRHVQRDAPLSRRKIPAADSSDRLRAVKYILKGLAVESNT